MTIKVLVVDDEECQRRELIRHVNWDRHNMTVIGDTESAQQALELAEDNPPDLVITDIRMQGMDGLELSKSLCAINKDIHIIMVTGYEEFEYAKTALNIGIDAFLVKPIDFIELDRTLQNINSLYFDNLKKQEEELHLYTQLKELLPIAREKFIHELLNGFIRDEESARIRSRYLHMFESDDMYAVIIVSKDPNGTELRTNGKDQDIIHLRIRRIAENVLDSILEEITTSRGDSVLIVKCPTGLDNDENLKQKLDIFHKEVEKDLNCMINMGIGPCVDALRKIADSFRLAQRAENQRLLLGPGQVIYWSDIGEKNICSDIGTSILVGDFLEALRLGERKHMDESFEAIVSELIETESVTEAETKSVCLELVSGASRIISEMGELLGKPFVSEKDLWKQVLDCDGNIQLLQTTHKILIQFCEHIAERKKNRYQSIMRYTLEYIDEHYGEDITLRVVAEKVYLSPNYLGMIFRNESGKSFTEHLTWVRMNKAKELLKGQRLKVSEVSKRVGYQNIAHFANLFKRHTGISPKDYRNFNDIQENDR